MIKKNKLKFIISSLIILLPMLFGIIAWNALPDIMTTHFGADGNADGFGSKAFVVLGLPVIFLVLHVVCLLFTLLDKKQREQSPKALGIVFWSVPVISLTVSAVMYRVTFGAQLDASFLGVLFGAMFIFMGNYLPKTKQNRTLGIRMYWTLRNEENWNKTHRFSGKLCVVCGFIILLSAFLPLSAAVTVLVCVIAVVAIVPIVFSYIVYRQHKKQGIVYSAAKKSRAEKLGIKISAVVVPLILAGAAVLMFTGNIEVSCEDSSLSINASYWSNISLDYSEIDAVEYRTDVDVGVRTNGFGSPRLSVGIFENGEFGSYTLYSYTGAEEFVVLRSGGKALVIGMKDASDTRAIYNTISEKTGC